MHILHSGSFAAEVAAELATALVKADASLKASIQEHSMANFKTWAKNTMLTDGDKEWPPLKVVFIAATIENEQPPEDGREHHGRRRTLVERDEGVLRQATQNSGGLS